SITTTTTLKDTAAGNITFDSTINDGNAAGTDGLTVDTTGLTDFKGSVGGTAALEYLDVDTGMGYSGGTTDINGAGVTTDSDGQIYGGAVLLTTTTTLKDTDAGNITFDSTINDGNAAGTDGLTVDTTGVTDFKGSVGNTVALQYLDVDNSSDINGAGVTTDAGGQIYGGPVLITTTTTLADTDAGNITFDSTINNGNAAGTDGLTVDTTGLTDFKGSVGNTAALQYLDVDTGMGYSGGTTDINGAGITTDAGGQIYGGAVLITTTTTLKDTDASNITFDSTINDGNAAGTDGLTVDTTGLTDFKGSVGNTVALQYLDVDNSSDINGAGVTTDVGGQTYGGAVSITTTTTLKDTDAGNITFDSTINDGNAAGTDGLTVYTTGLTDFEGDVGNTKALDALDVDTGMGYSGSSIDINGASVTTSGTQTYYGIVTLTSSVNLTGTTISFEDAADSVDSQATKDYNLTVTGDAVFDGPVGSAVNGQLGTLDVTGTTSLAGNVTSTGNQTYDGNLTLLDTGSAKVFTLLAGANLVTFGGTVNGTTAGDGTLTIGSNSQATNASFGSTVGNTVSLAALTVWGTTSLGGNVTTSVTQSYTDTVTLTSSVNLTGTTISFEDAADSVDSQATKDYNLTVTGDAVFDGPVGSAVNGQLGTLDVTGTTSLAGNVTSTGNQTYDGNLTLLDTGSAKVFTLLAGANLVTFGGTVNGATADDDTLTIGSNSQATDASFGANVGSNVSLAALTVYGTTSLGGNVTTNGTQSYTDTVTLTSSVNLTGTTISFEDAADSVESDPGNAYNLTVTGDAVFDGPVGTDANGQLGTLDVTGTTLLGGNVTSTGNQTYVGSVTLNNNITMTGATLSATGSPTFIGPGQTLELDFTTINPTNFSDVANLIFSEPYALDGTLIGANDTTTFQQAITLGDANNSLTSTGSGANFILQGNVIAGTPGDSLTIGTPSTIIDDVTFDSSLGSEATPLGALYITGNTIFGGPNAINVFTNNGETYANSVTLNQDVTLTDSGAKGISFKTTVNGAYSLTAIAGDNPANVMFNGTVGGITPLASLTVGDPNIATTTTLNGNVTTTGPQTYYGTIILDKSLTMTGTILNALGDPSFLENGTGFILVADFLSFNIPFGIPIANDEVVTVHIVIPPPPQISPIVILSAAQVATLLEAGINARNPDIADSLGMSSHGAVFNDIPEKYGFIIFNPTLKDYFVTVDRLPYSQTEAFIADYLKIFFVPVIDKTTGKQEVNKKGGHVYKSIRSDLGAMFTAAYADYLVSLKGTTNNNEPTVAGFRAFLINREPGVWLTVLDLRHLLIEAQNLGLGEAEYNLSRNTILADLCPDQMQPQEFVNLVEGSDSQN
ncbi:MAG TPA: hypothetical protein VMG59_12290, partial [Phycisphaerae bacterium]|nr:hypothetical protein [Phycisphaerae bacterium]